MKRLTQKLCLVGLLVAISAAPVAAQQVELTLREVKTGVDYVVEANTPVEEVEQNYQVQVPYTDIVKQNFTVTVPYTENVTKKYTVEVPYTETVTADDGSTKEVQRTRTEERERVVPVTKMRNETRTRMVPVTRTRTEKRTRMVPVIRTRCESRSVNFPYPNAKYAYVSGEEISVEEMKELAAESITVVRLAHDETLSELQQQILKPELIVMTMPPPKEDVEEDGEAEKADAPEAEAEK